MREQHWLSACVRSGTADGVVEDDDLLGAGDVGGDYGLDFRVVNRLNMVIRDELGFGGRDISDCNKCLLVE